MTFGDLDASSCNNISETIKNSEGKSVLMEKYDKFFWPTEFSRLGNPMIIYRFVFVSCRSLTLPKLI